MKRILSTLIISLSSLSFSFACSTVSWTFCEFAHYRDYTIVQGEIIETFTNGLTLEISVVYRGDESRKEIRVWDDSPRYCTDIRSKTVDNIGSLGETVLVQLEKIDTLKNNWDVVGDYRNTKFDIIHTRLTLKGNYFIGALTQNVNHPNQKVQKTHKDKISKILNECLENNNSLLNPALVISEPKTLIFYPNPTKDYLFISNNAESADVSIYNLNGQIVASKTIFIAEEGIQVSHLTPGVYICLANIDGVIFRQKFIVFED